LKEAGKWALAQCRGTDLQRSQKLVVMQNFNNGQMRESGFITRHQSVLVAGAKAKTVTNKLPLLSVLAVEFYSSPK
jgi:translation elongation factor EF-4